MINDIDFVDCVWVKVAPLITFLAAVVLIICTGMRDGRRFEFMFGTAIALIFLTIMLVGIGFNLTEEHEEAAPYEVRVHNRAAIYFKKEPQVSDGLLKVRYPDGTIEAHSQFSIIYRQK